MERKNLLLTIICFCLSFNYYIIRALKDALLVTSTGGAEAIPFVKTWFLIPASLLLSFAFAFLTRKQPIARVAGGFIAAFLVFYLGFVFYLFPKKEMFEPSALCAFLSGKLPAGWEGFIAIVRHWPLAMFYTASECWGIFVFSILFWTLASDATSRSEAERHYPFYILAGNFSALAAGPAAIFLTDDSWELTLFRLTLLIACLGLFSACLLPLLPTGQRKKQESATSKPLLPFRELLRSKYLLAMAAIGFFFHLAVYIVEIPWKEEIFALYSDPKSYNIYMSYVTIAVGIFSSLISLVVCQSALKNFGWTATALIPITAIFFTGILFLYSLIPSPFFLPAALTGSIHTILTQSSRHTLYDITREMAYLPIEIEQRIEGKAAVCGVASRLGKISSSIVYQALFIAFPTVNACVPAVGLIFSASLLVCFAGTLFLGKLYHEAHSTSLS